MSAHPHLKAWWPTGHRLGWAGTFVSQAGVLPRVAGTTKEQPPSSCQEELVVQRVMAVTEWFTASRPWVLLGVVDIPPVIIPLRT